MDQRTHKNKRHITDVTPAKNVASMPTKHLLIPHRPIVGRNATNQPAPDPLLDTTQSRRTMIVPVDANSDLETDQSDSSTAVMSVHPSKGVAIKVPKQASTSSEPSTPDPPFDTDTQITETSPPEESPVTDDTDATGQAQGANDKPAQAAPATRKALEDAAAAAEQAEKLQSYIDSRQFFVPINAVAQKRSIKISLVMTIVVFLLSVVLVDLMLDSGAILLVQKIPHTHFFNIGGSKGD